MQALIAFNHAASNGFTETFVIDMPSALGVPHLDTRLASVISLMDMMGIYVNVGGSIFDMNISLMA